MLLLDMGLYQIVDEWMNQQDAEYWQEWQLETKVIDAHGVHYQQDDSHKGQCVDRHASSITYWEQSIDTDHKSRTHHAGWQSRQQSEGPYRQYRYDLCRHVVAMPANDQRYHSIDNHKVQST